MAAPKKKIVIKKRKIVRKSASDAESGGGPPPVPGAQPAPVKPATILREQAKEAEKKVASAPVRKAASKKISVAKTGPSPTTNSIEETAPGIVRDDGTTVVPPMRSSQAASQTIMAVKPAKPAKPAKAASAKAAESPDRGQEMFKFFCIRCGQKLSAPRAGEGKSIRCPRCKNRLQVPPPLGH